MSRGYSLSLGEESGEAGNENKTKRGVSTHLRLGPVVLLGRFLGLIVSLRMME